MENNYKAEDPSLKLKYPVGLWYPMKKMFLLSKENLPLAVEEVRALANPKAEKRIGNLLILDTNAKNLERLAFTKAIYQYLFDCSVSQLDRKTAAFNWNKIYRNNYAVRTFGKYQERELADIIWQKLKDPSVDLKNPATEIHFFFTKGKVVAGKLIKKIPYDFDSRKAHKRAVHAPTGMHPRLARAIINLTGIKSGTLVDPFCGTGGILIEAGLMGLKPVGYDIRPEMIIASRKNLQEFNLKAELHVQDSLTLKKSFNYIVTDLPYGTSTTPVSENFYRDVIKLVKKLARKRAVVVFPHSYNPRQGKQLLQYIHKSLSRRIVILSP